MNCFNLHRLWWLSASFQADGILDPIFIQVANIPQKRFKIAFLYLNHFILVIEVVRLLLPSIFT